MVQYTFRLIFGYVHPLFSAFYFTPHADDTTYQDDYLSCNKFPHYNVLVYQGEKQTASTSTFSYSWPSKALYALHVLTLFVTLYTFQCSNMIAVTLANKYWLPQKGTCRARICSPHSQPIMPCERQNKTKIIAPPRIFERAARLNRMSIFSALPHKWLLYLRNELHARTWLFHRYEFSICRKKT